jgi:uracil-DNA glycosylase family 4
MSRRDLDVLAERIESCRACPRLVRHREHVALVKRRAYRDETYHGRPVAGFGDPKARIVVVGLAPGAHGANRTGRVFTGDRSGDFLFAALHRAGLASQPTATARRDGLRLHDTFITLAARCVPPDNRPAPIELQRCAHWLDEELALLERKRVLLALGSIAFATVLGFAERSGVELPSPRPRFAHGGHFTLGPYVLVASYHVSQQNTQTGRLTPRMFHAILARAKKFAVSGS